MEQLVVGSREPKTSVPASDIIIIQLHDLIDCLGAEIVYSALQTFSCSCNPDIQRFLQDTACLYEKTHKCRTYLLLIKDKFELSTPEIDIFAYYALSIAPLELHGQVSASKKKDLHGLSAPHAGRLYGFLIGQLGKNDRYADTVLDNTSCLESAMETLQDRVQSVIGGRFAVVECENEEKLI